MTDKKSLPEKQSDTWEDSTNDNLHQRTYYSGDGDRIGKTEEDDEIRPIDEADTSRSAPKSQALLDIQEAGMTPEEAARASKELAVKVSEGDEKSTKKSAKEDSAKKGGDSRRGAENLVAIAKFRWIFLFVLSLVSVAAWAVEAFISKRPYNWEAAGWLGLTIILTIPTLKFLRLPTRAGLAALFWAGCFFISALYGPDEFLFGNIPAALNWVGLLTLIMLWMGVAIWRKLGRYRVIDLVLSLVLIYAAFAPVGALITSVTSGAALNLSFKTLAASPDFITGHLPWVFWPMTITVLLILPFCAFFSLWDQFSAFRRKGGRHGGNFFLALAFILLIPYAFLSYDKAVSAFPKQAQVIRSVWPSAMPFAREHNLSQAVVSTADNHSAETPTAPPAAVPPLTSDQPYVQTDPVPAPTIEQPQSVAPESAFPGVDPAPLADPSAPSDVHGEMTKPAIPPSATFEERLQTTSDRLEEALSRILELEREMKLLKQPDTETRSGPPSGTEETKGMVDEGLAKNT